MFFCRPRSLFSLFSNFNLSLLLKSGQVLDLSANVFFALQSLVRYWTHLVVFSFHCRNFAFKYYNILFFSITFSNLLLLQIASYWFCILIFSPSPLSLFLYSFINFSGGLFGFVLESNCIFCKWCVLIFLCINSSASSILSLPAPPLLASLLSPLMSFLFPLHNAQGFNFFTSLHTLVILCFWFGFVL